MVDAIEAGDAPDEEDVEEIVEVLRDALEHPNHPWRSLLGVPGKRGRPRKQADERITWYVELSRLYGHTKEEACALAAEAFGYKDSRTVEKLVAKTASLSGPVVRVWENLLRRRGGPFPPPAPTGRKRRPRTQRRQTRRT